MHAWTGMDSADDHPWQHPFLTADRIARFRRYSEQVWSFALEHDACAEAPLRCGFAVNMAQNMAKWSRLCQEAGVTAELFPHPWDRTALNAPEWEEFDGTVDDPLDGDAFLAAHGDVPLPVPTRRVTFDGAALRDAHCAYRQGERRALLELTAALETTAPGMRCEPFFSHGDLSVYYEWAQALNAFDVNYTASVPLAAYLSGRPYCFFSVGGDLQYDAGRADEYGQAMNLACNAARFLTVSNPHALGHSRRLGLTNGVYLPYPMDDDRYAPGPGHARAEWEARLGAGVFVLVTTRIDARVKGFGAECLRALVEAARAEPALRFVYVRWGQDQAAFEELVAEAGLADRFLGLPAAGKRRLIDYYRSCDAVLDQLTFGYYGTTGLEAAAVGKPVLIRLRRTQYDALYDGDGAPMIDVDGTGALRDRLVEIARDPGRRDAVGAATRDWLVRTHGRERTVPLLKALLRVAADRMPLPAGLVSPLHDEPDDEEHAYHESCKRAPAS
jgi:glycosyltransferase involved in cell wall biosynthesis